MNWEKIKWFYEACKELNISKTSDRLNISQPALSRHISCLEEIVGSKLFNRSRTGLVLTESGIRVFEIAKNMAQQVKSLNEFKSMGNQFHKNTLNLETSVTLATMWLPHYIPKFVEKNPGIQLYIEGIQDEAHFLCGGADVAISTYMPNRKDLKQEHLLTFHLGLYASPDYLQKHGFPKNISELESHQFISHGKKELHQYGVGINSMFEKDNNLKLKAPIVMNMGTSIVTVASKGMGIIVLSSEYPGLPECGLVQILPEINCEVEVFLSYPREKSNYLPIRKLKNFLQMELNNNTKELSKNVIKFQNMQSRQSGSLQNSCAY